MELCFGSEGSKLTLSGNRRLAAFANTCCCLMKGIRVFSCACAAGAHPAASRRITFLADTLLDSVSLPLSVNGLFPCYIPSVKGHDSALFTPFLCLWLKDAIRKLRLVSFCTELTLRTRPDSTQQISHGWRHKKLKINGSWGTRSPVESVYPFSHGAL